MPRLYYRQAWVSIRGLGVSFGRMGTRVTQRRAEAGEQGGTCERHPGSRPAQDPPAQRQPSPLLPGIPQADSVAGLHRFPGEHETTEKGPCSASPTWLGGSARGGRGPHQGTRNLSAPPQAPPPLSALGTEPLSRRHGTRPIPPRPAPSCPVQRRRGRARLLHRGTAPAAGRAGLTCSPASVLPGCLAPS